MFFYHIILITVFIQSIWIWQLKQETMHISAVKREHYCFPVQKGKGRGETIGRRDFSTLCQELWKIRSKKETNWPAYVQEKSRCRI